MDPGDVLVYANNLLKKNFRILLTNRFKRGIIYIEVKERKSIKMTESNVILMNLISRYESVAYTNNYIYGFTYKSFVYYIETTGLKFGVKLDKASSKNGGGYSIRYNPTKAVKEDLINSGVAKVLCTKDFFNTEKANSIYNRGEIFEKLITEKNGQKWVKDTVPFYEGADLTTDKAWSIKFEKATICTEKTLNRIGA